MDTKAVSFLLLVAEEKDEEIQDARRISCAMVGSRNLRH